MMQKKTGQCAENPNSKKWKHPSKISYTEKVA